MFMNRRVIASMDKKSLRFDCQFGLGTNRACCHVLAVAKVLFGRALFRTTKRKAGACTDVHVPRSQQPALSVPPMSGQGFCQLPVGAPRKSKDTRQNRQPMLFGNLSGIPHCSLLFYLLILDFHDIHLFFCNL